MKDAAPKAVILGAAGFLGINLAHALCRRGYDVVCFDRFTSSKWPEACKVLSGDFTQPSDELIGEMSGAIVFHLVSTTKPAATTSRASEELISNVASTVQILERTIGKNVRWVFASSGGTVYGQPQVVPIQETHATAPICSYGVAKLATEKYFQLFNVLHGSDYVIARLSNPFGPWQPTSGGQGLISHLFHRLMRQECVEVWGDGENLRDYIYVDDAIDALLALAEGRTSAEIFNIGSGEGKSINQAIAQVSKALGVEPEVVRTPPRRMDVGQNVLDTSKIQRATDWRPTHDFATGIHLYYQWIRNFAPDRKEAIGISERTGT